MTLSEIPTPAVLIESSTLARNIARMQEAVAAGGKTLRPHGKTHKSPVIARMQIDAGAKGICCAKLGEAEVFADAGVDRHPLPYPLQPANADRVFALADRVTLSFIVDDPASPRVVGPRGRARPQADVLIKVDVGFHRCGIDPAGPRAADRRGRSRRCRVCFPRLLSHAGHGYGAHPRPTPRRSPSRKRASCATSRPRRVCLSEI
jgi:D-serine deaminase-like pyridoxal phosphate-dependent protein